ncbi:MAG: amino acid adenylation domain-containing protein, partial [bacterium]|nr:amino acid adenylation domain-containing protein [bacterium]
NTVLALRCRLDEGMTFKELLLHVRQTQIEATEHQNYPIGTLLYKLDIESSPGEFPLFDTAVLLENIHDIDYLRDIVINTVFSFLRTDAAIEGTLKYNSLLYTPTDIEVTVSHLLNFFENAFKDIDAPLEAIDIFTPKEKERIIYRFNDTDTAVPGDKTLYNLFQERVEALPEETALIFEDESMTYRELNREANRLAALLRENGVTKNRIAGIMVERSMEMIAAMLAVLKAGGAYMPIDSTYPADRIKYMLKDSGAVILLSKSLLEEKIETEIPVIHLDHRQHHDGNFDSPEEINGPGDIAYLIYTSGSTGRQKAVVVEHRSIVNTLIWRKEYYGFTTADMTLQIPSFSFDSSVEDIFMALVSGAKLVLLLEENRYNIKYLEKVIAKNNITHFLIVPGFYKIFLDELAHALGDVKTITIAGDAFAEHLVEEHFAKLPNVRLLNEYGPSENSVCSTVYEFVPGDIKLLIGRPINNVYCYVLNKKGNIAPVGMAGELCLSGAGLARGYLNNPEVTDEKFVANPFIKGERLYRSGDLVRLKPDGNMEFVGRMDHQVKIRGYRIELGEIENRLLERPEIKECVVIVKEDNKGDKYLCAYLAADEEKHAMELKECLAENLPDYMLPSIFVYIEKIPLTANGKVERKSLPEPEIKRKQERIAPRNQLEEKLAAIWLEGLELPEENMGIDDDFFELGGHSLKATVMVAQVHKRFQVNVPLAEVFRTPTIRGLARYIEGACYSAHSSIEVVEKRDYYPLSAAQKRMYVLQQMETGNTIYNMPYITIPPERYEKEKLQAAFRELAARHESLRTSFHIVDDQPVQKIHPSAHVEIECLKVTQQEVEAEINRFIRPFDLAEAPIFRAALLEIESSHRQVLLMDLHHIITDGTSQEILGAEFAALHAGEQLPPAKLQYKDFTHWQNEFPTLPEGKKQEEYWLKQFEVIPPQLGFPTDYPRPERASYDGELLLCQINARLTAAIAELTATSGTTIYILLLAVYSILLSKYSTRKDIVV